MKTRCKICGQPISWIWAEVEGFPKKLAVNGAIYYKKDGNGPYDVYDDFQLGIIRQVRKAEPNEEHDGIGYVLHTCNFNNDYYKNKLQKRYQQDRT